MWKVALLVLSLALIASLALSCSDEPELVRFGADGDYFPYNFLDDAGEVDGFEADLIDEVCRRANLECAWVITPWDGIIDSLIAKEFDVIATGMSINEERDLVIDFTQPYLPPTPSIYVTLASANEDVLNGKIGAGVSTVHSAYLSESGADFVEIDGSEALFAALLAGEVDAVLVDREFGHQSIADSGGRLSILGSPIILEEGIGAGLREDDVDLKEKLNEAIGTMKADGSLNDLIRKWFDEDAEVF